MSRAGVERITDASGAVLERLTYDPWGKRRNMAQGKVGLGDATNAIVGQNTSRGYTEHEHEHEHLDEVGVIHMNGRVYDSLMGRFMSADPIIQDPTDLRSFNRYSYVWDNPLALTDPSGYSAYWDSYGSCGYTGDPANPGINPSYGGSHSSGGIGSSTPPPAPQNTGAGSGVTEPTPVGFGIKITAQMLYKFANDFVQNNDGKDGFWHVPQFMRDLADKYEPDSPEGQVGGTAVLLLSLKDI